MQKVHCDNCGAEGARPAHRFEKRVALAQPIGNVSTARVHIHVYLDDRAGRIPDLCDPCCEKLAAAPVLRRTGADTGRTETRDQA